MAIEFFRKFDISRFRLYDGYDKQMDLIQYDARDINQLFLESSRDSKHQDYFWPNVFPR